MTEWQPIHTAPMNKFVRLLYDEQETWGDKDDDGWHLENLSMCVDTPAGWLPLPKDTDINDLPLTVFGWKWLKNGKPGDTWNSKPFGV